jgi:hypothetical protein
MTRSALINYTMSHTALPAAGAAESPIMTPTTYTPTGFTNGASTSGTSGPFLPSTPQAYSSFDAAPLY